MNPGSELDVLEAARDLTGGVGEDLAVLSRDDRGELVGAFTQELAKREEHSGSFGQRGVSPVLGGGHCRCDGAVDLVAGGQIHLGAHHPRRGVVDEGRSAGGAWGLTAVDPVSDSPSLWDELCHGCRLRAKCTHHKRMFAMLQR